MLEVESACSRTPSDVAIKGMAGGLVDFIIEVTSDEPVIWHLGNGEDVGREA